MSDAPQPSPASRVAPGEPGPARRTLGRELRSSFFAGLLIIAPLATSLIIFIGLFNWVTNFLLPARLREDELTVLWRIAALVLFLALVVGIGWITRLVAGRELVAICERIIRRIPLLNRVYGFTKEVSDTLLGSKKTVFERVVLVEYPRAGVYTVGFVTNEGSGETQTRTGQQVINVFFPTTPNPTSGWLALVPKAQVIDLDMSVADGMKLIISGGAFVPPPPPAAKPPAPPT